jgi:hypothetical protein
MGWMNRHCFSIHYNALLQIEIQRKNMDSTAIEELATYLQVSI